MKGKWIEGGNPLTEEWIENAVSFNKENQTQQHHVAFSV